MPTQVSRELTHLRSQDSGGREEGTEVKQQINSLDFLRRIIDSRVNRLDKGADLDSMGTYFICRGLSDGLCGPGSCQRVVWARGCQMGCVSSGVYAGFICVVFSYFYFDLYLYTLE